jgi:hypothetical protein
MRSVIYEMQSASQCIAKYIKKSKQSIKISLSPETQHTTKKHTSKNSSSSSYLARDREKIEKNMLRNENDMKRHGKLEYTQLRHAESIGNV